MRRPRHTVLVLGATGYVGRVVTRRLVGAGHQVVALVRSEDRAADLPPGVETRTGDVTDQAGLAAAITTEVTAVVNVATPSGDLHVDALATAAVLSSLAEVPGRAYLYTSGVWVMGATAGEPVDESASTRPLDIVGYRPVIEQQVLDGAAAGIRTVVIRPGVVHGYGGGIPALLVRLAAAHGRGVYVGERVAPRWPMVHLDDLAELYLLALDTAPAASIYHAVTEPGVDTAELAEAAAFAAGVAPDIAAWSPTEAAVQLGGEFAEALACDQVVLGERARRLGWKPEGPRAVEDLREGSYAAEGAR